MAINLFCLPPAGSSASLYTNWDKLTPDTINVIPVEYPGHGSLVRQPLIKEPEKLANVIASKIQTYGEQGFAIFGHSVGAALIWRVEEILRTSTLRKHLKLLIVSGRPESEFSSKMQPKRFLSKEGLIKALRHYNSVPLELLENEDAMAFFLTILRNDFHLNDMMLQDIIPKTDTPLLALYGKNDPDIPFDEQMQAWQKHSKNWQGCYSYSGGHFFFNENTSLMLMLDQISITISEVTSNQCESKAQFETS